MPSPAHRHGPRRRSCRYEWRHRTCSLHIPHDHGGQEDTALVAIARRDEVVCSVLVYIVRSGVSLRVFLIRGDREHPDAHTDHAVPIAFRLKAGRAGLEIYIRHLVSVRVFAIEDLEALYTLNQFLGKDTDGDKMPNIYLKA